MGWRNPTHVIARRSVAGLALVVTQPVSPSLTLWSAPPGGRERPRALGEVALRPGATFDLLERDAGAEDTRGASAEQYRLWYRVRLPDGRAGWVQAAVPDSRETDPQGRPVGVRFNLVPALVRAAIDRAR
jgi:hypothetical protein